MLSLPVTITKKILTDLAFLLPFYGHLFVFLCCFIKFVCCGRYHRGPVCEYFANLGLFVLAVKRIANKTGRNKAIQNIRNIHFSRLKNLFAKFTEKFSFILNEQLFFSFYLNQRSHFHRQRCWISSRDRLLQNNTESIAISNHIASYGVQPPPRLWTLSRFGFLRTQTRSVQICRKAATSAANCGRKSGTWSRT